MRSNAILNVEYNDKCCFLWSILADLHPGENIHPSGVKNYTETFNDLNIEGFEFTNGFNCSDVHKLEKLNTLSANIFDLIFYQDQNKWKHNLIIETSKIDESDRVVDLSIYKNHYELKKKLNMFLGEHHKNFICRRCLNSYTSENILRLQKPKFENYDITTIKTSSNSHLQWKNHFHQNLL